MKRIILLALVTILCYTCTINNSYAANPKFRLHILDIHNLTGVNYAINYPVVIDYDLDGDLDILIMSKEGTLYFLENLTIVKE